jgi:hypothetical protein
LRKKISEIKRRVPEARLRGDFVWGRKSTAAASLIIIAKNGGFSNRFDYKYKNFFSYIRPRSKREKKDAPKGRLTRSANHTTITA